MVPSTLPSNWHEWHVRNMRHIPLRKLILSELTNLLLACVRTFLLQDLVELLDLRQESRQPLMVMRLAFPKVRLRKRKNKQESGKTKKAGTVL